MMQQDGECLRQAKRAEKVAVEVGLVSLIAIQVFRPGHDSVIIPDLRYCRYLVDFMDNVASSKMMRCTIDRSRALL